MLRRRRSCDQCDPITPRTLPRDSFEGSRPDLTPVYDPGMTRRRLFLILVVLVVGSTVAAWGYAKSRGVGVSTVIEEVIRGGPGYEVLAGAPLKISIVRRYADSLLADPVDVAELPDSSLLLALKAGALIHLDPQTGVAREILDIRDRVRTSTEEGMLAVALHPQFGAGKETRVYITYIDGNDGSTRLDVFNLDPTGLTLVEPLTNLFSFEHFNKNHMAADMEFSPNGLLLLATGDSGGSGDPERSAQDPDSSLGKILEIDVDVMPIAPVNRAIGLRNPWKVAIGSKSGALWIADVGQDGVEEVSVLNDTRADPPVNFGWPIVEGESCYAALSCTKPTDYVAPRTSYAHNAGRCSIIGAAFAEEHFLFADYCSGEFFAIPLDAAAATEPTAVKLTGKWPRLMPVALFSDSLGRVWIIDQLKSKIFQVSVSR